MSVTKKTGIFARLSRLLMAVEDGVTLLQPEEIVISDRAKGGKVERKATDGTLTPIDDGVYELPDGFRFTITGGFISETGDAENATTETEAGKEGDVPKEEIKAAEEGAPVPPAEAAAPVPGLDELTQRVAALETLMGEIKSMLTDANTALAKDTEAATKAEQAYTAMSTQLVELAKEVKLQNETTPAAASASRTNPGATKKNDQVKEEKRQATATAMSKVMQRLEKKD